VNFSDNQIERLIYLGEKRSNLINIADDSFQRIEKNAVRRNKNILENYLEITHEPQMEILKKRLREALYKNNFSEVQTPTIIPKNYLEKMTVDEFSPLWNQVFRVDKNLFLRPMLAPGLYDVSRKLIGLMPLPLRIFEIGTCYRKESEGKNHLREFTMLNLVEWGTPLDERSERLRFFGQMIMDAAGIENYHFEDENSVVYGDGTDITDSNGVELASSSFGPHSLDNAWKMTCSWVGIGFGLERILASKNDCENIQRYARSVSYLDGAALDIK
jgi:phenylalanyl-tRNA synthetase alpha chain